VLEALVAGPDDALPLVFHTGTPSGLVWNAPLAEAAAARGLRTVMYARPGYGGSTPQPGRLVADAAADVDKILERIGADEFVTAGWSGGGPHALACAALLPVRCLAAATIAGAAPYDSPGLDWMAGMAEENHEEFRAALAGEADLTTFLNGAAGSLREISAAQVADGLGGLLSETDKAALTAEFADHLAASLRAAVTPGIDGWRDDDLAFTRDWGLSLDALGHATPVAIWQGDQDRMVPSTHGAWLAANIPLARARFRSGEGHLSLINRLGEILDDLMTLARPPEPGSG
jgi:pimeloyl-ACP methyl ester carboxylesterase